MTKTSVRPLTEAELHQAAGGGLISVFNTLMNANRDRPGITLSDILVSN